MNQVFILCAASLAFGGYGLAAAREVVVHSPDTQLRATIETDELTGLRWRVEKNGLPLLEPARLGLKVNGTDWGNGAQIVSVERGRSQRTYPFRGAKSVAMEDANTATLHLKTGTQSWSIQTRAANDGVAYRYLFSGQDSYAVNGEASAFHLPAATKIWFGERNNAWKLRTHAGTWLSADIDAMPKVSSQGPVQTAPLICEFPQGGFGLISEAANFDYSGMRLRAIGERTFAVDFAEGTKGFALEGGVVSPWRVFISTPDLNGLVNSTFIQNLSPTPDKKLFEDTSYIRPGRAVWRWQLRGTGSLENQKQYVDFANKLGWEYSLVDEGWERDWKPPLQQLTELCAYASARKVGVLVWKRWGEVSNPATDYAALRQWMDGVKAADVAGIKMDFFDAEDLNTRHGEELVLEEAAKRRLLVVLHGCPKPTGEEIRYPNLLTREGIRGLELNFMNEGALTASHNAALPFTRCAVGPADYTPVTFQRLGGTTVPHQLATVINIGSPLQIFTAFPEDMLNHPETEVTRFLKAVPAVWDETRVLPGSKIGELAVIARRQGKTWFVAALNGGEAREYSLNCDFLGAQPANAVLLQDGATPTTVNAQRQHLKRGDTITLKMAKGGGFVVWFPA